MDVIEVESRLPEFALHWAGQLGTRSESLTRLRGGINNQVFRCGHGSQHWVIKGYPPPKPGKPDRMQAEVAFLRFAALAAPCLTPILIEEDSDRRCLILEHLDGKTFPQGIAPSKGAISRAVEFYRQLNDEPRLAREYVKLEATEGFLSLREHLNNVRERLERMTCVHLDHEFRPQAETLLRQMRREFAVTENSTSSMIHRGMVEDAIIPDERFVSPGDFGFHNAIRTHSGIYFIDFEFAGWDDPAKTVTDFTLQPRFQAMSKELVLLGSLLESRRKRIANRCFAMAPILRLKWMCIILGILNPHRLQERIEVSPRLEIPKVIRAQIAMAKRYRDATDTIACWADRINS